MLLTLPYPPSVNHYWRHFRGRVLISREGRAYRKVVVALLAGSGNHWPSDARLALCMDVYPPDRRRRDLDNAQKASLDSIEHAGVYADDGQIDLLITRRCEPVKGGKLIVRIDSLPLRLCPLCGAAMHEETD
ncbi:MAG: RusA family crossover junction endodeoxyribonuclease [Phycisphaerae bacterium]|nr:RusA family crossover junction endodeoxyribonuclease [Phycisphaerae bacterium]